MLKKAELNRVSVTGGVFKERMEVNKKYLLELDPACLLQNFYLEAAIIIPGLQILPDPENANMHWGWESPTCQLRGHFLGHFLSAASMLAASGKEPVLEKKTEYIINELERCQIKNGGEWAGPIPEKYMDLLRTDAYIWSPQYTMHKLIMGLIHTGKYTGNKKALSILSKLADWYVKWTDRMGYAPDSPVFKGEQAGMLEAWADAYDLTKDDKYRTLIDAYSGNQLYKNLEEKKDALTDRHTNASIPLSHGSARLYEITGDKRWSDLTDEFWDEAVNKRGMLATTGNNAGEFFIPPHKMGEYIADNDQEFCTVYNMVRTADYLLRKTGDRSYADYIERAIYNGFLAQQNPHTGMPTYFLPLRSGSRKKWGSKTRDFWCCHGTMVQAQTLYPQLIYYTDDNDITLMQYIPSEASFTINDTNVTLNLSTKMQDYDTQVLFDDGGSSSEKTRWSMELKVHSDKSTEFALKLRIPAWAESSMLLINGEKKDAGQISDNGYLCIKRAFLDDTINILFVSRIVMEPLPDMPSVAAAIDGPIVLAGMTDNDTLKGDFKDPSKIFYPRTEHTYSTYTWKQNCYVTRHQDKNIEFKPLYDVTDETYTVYFEQKGE